MQVIELQQKITALIILFLQSFDIEIYFNFLPISKLLNFQKSRHYSSQIHKILSPKLITNINLNGMRLWVRPKALQVASKHVWID